MKDIQWKRLRCLAQVVAGRGCHLTDYGSVWLVRTVRRNAAEKAFRSLLFKWFSSEHCEVEVLAVAIVLPVLPTAQRGHASIRPGLRKVG